MESDRHSWSYMHNTLLVFTHNYALLTLGSRFLGCNVHANQLCCGFTACSMHIDTARKPQQYNYNSLWL